MKKTTYTISIYTENNVGLLNRVSAIFLKRHINIVSITSSESEIPDIFRFVIVVNISKEQVVKVVKQIDRISVSRLYDFIDATKSLIEKGYGDSQNVFAMGGSAGGLLMGAVINIEPDLYNGVIAHVPFVDVVTTMLDESIPLTTGEYDEWGNPNNEEYYNKRISR